MSRPLTAAQPRRDAGHRPTAHGACRSMAIAGAAVMAILGVQCFLARTRGRLSAGACRNSAARPECRITRYSVLNVGARPGQARSKQYSAPSKRPASSSLMRTTADPARGSWRAARRGDAGEQAVHGVCPPLRPTCGGRYAAFVERFRDAIGRCHAAGPNFCYDRCNGGIARCYALRLQRGTNLAAPAAGLNGFTCHRLLRASARKKMPRRSGASHGIMTRPDGEP
jgi:hypothetical protein